MFKDRFVVDDVRGYICLETRCLFLLLSRVDGVVHHEVAIGSYVAVAVDCRDYN